MADIGPVQSSQALHFQPDVRRGVAPDTHFSIQTGTGRVWHLVIVFKTFLTSILSFIDRTRSNVFKTTPIFTNFKIQLLILIYS